MSNSTATILIADDDPGVRHSFADYLEDRDYRILTAENGFVGLQTFKREHPDLVLLDLRMPEMDGIELLRGIRETGSDVPLIVVSGTGRIADAVEALRLGAWDYLLKPVADLSVLAHTVQKSLERARLLKENRAYQDNLERLVHERTVELERANERLRSFNKALSESERRFRELADMLPQAICETDRTGTITYSNQKALESFGYTADELTAGLKTLDMIASQDRERAEVNIREVLLAGEERSVGTEYTAVRKDGTCFPALIYSAPIMEGTEPRGMRNVVVNISERKKQEELILHHAHFDSLTGLPNRFLALDRLAQLIKESQRAGTLIAVFFLDLDDFKKVNDTLGHNVGDRLLLQAAERLRDTVRKVDTIGRLGGDEFIVLLGGLTGAEDARPMAEHLLTRFRDAFRLDNQELVLTASLGISVYPADGDTAAELLRKADTAMYHAKEQGRNTYHFFTAAMNRDVTRRLMLEQHLHGALGRGEFYLRYQPLVRISNRTVVGFEALLRWNNPVLGEVSPAEFIPVAEQTGLIVPIGQYVLTEALAVAAPWQGQYGPALKIAVNFSPRQFRDSNLPHQLAGALRQNRIPSALLELEITEGVLMSGRSEIDTSLSALSDLGVGISMDDFGTGYSSLSYLRRYPFDTLKIDRSFVNDITVDPGDRELVNAAIAMARGLGLHVVAEGVETEEQLAQLEKHGCEFAQGYFFSKPVAPEEIAAILERQQG